MVANSTQHISDHPKLVQEAIRIFRDEIHFKYNHLNGNAEGAKQRSIPEPILPCDLNYARSVRVPSKANIAAFCEAHVALCSALRAASMVSASVTWSEASVIATRDEPSVSITLGSIPGSKTTNSLRGPFSVRGTLESPPIRALHEYCFSSFGKGLVTRRAPLHEFDLSCGDFQLDEEKRKKDYEVVVTIADHIASNPELGARAVFPRSTNTMSRNVPDSLFKEYRTTMEQAAERSGTVPRRMSFHGYRHGSKPVKIRNTLLMGGTISQVSDNKIQPRQRVTNN